MEQFIEDQGITMTSRPVPENPNMEREEGKEQQWADEAFHYKVVLKKGRKSFTTYFSMGSAHQDPPTVEEVLDSLASDASTVENARSFEDWASELGYDTDSRKAERIYNTIVKLSGKLKDFLGEAAYKALLWDIERG